MNKQKLGAREAESSCLEVGDVVEAEVVEGDDDGSGDVALPRHPEDGVRGGDLVQLVVGITIWGRVELRVMRDCDGPMVLMQTNYICSLKSAVPSDDTDHWRPLETTVTV